MSKQRVQKSQIGSAEVKGQSGGNIPPVFRSTSEEEISITLTIVTNEVGGRPPILTQKQICELSLKGSTTVSNWVKEGALPAVWFIRIAHEAARRGDFSLVNLIIPRNYALTPIAAGSVNGDCSDEECALVGAVDRARIAFEAGDVNAFDNEMTVIKQQVASLESEGRAIR